MEPLHTKYKTEQEEGEEEGEEEEKKCCHAKKEKKRTTTARQRDCNAIEYTRKAPVTDFIYSV